jgi:glycosyltransferase involved in cell wall biosynthesis
LTTHAKDIFHDSVDRDDLARKIGDSAATVTVSDFNLAHLRDRFPEHAYRIVRVYNGLDLSQFRFELARDRRPRIVSVGRLIPKKGFAVLLEACRILQAQSVRFVCEIVGSGELEQALRDQISRFNLRDSVVLLGPRPQTEVVELVRQAHVFAAPCVVGEDGNRDGLPTVLLEAMALGTPCVATDVTGIPELVRHGDTGLIVPQNDARSLAAAIRALLRDEPQRHALARRARSLVEAEFDVHRNAAEIRRLFPPTRRPTRAPHLPLAFEAC